MKTDVHALSFNRVQDPRTCWPYVKQGLLRILEACPDEPWGPEDVFHMVRTGKIGLYLVNEGPSVLGFFAVEIIEQPFTHKPGLHIWFLYASGNNGANFADFLQHQDKVMGCVDQLAADCKLPPDWTFKGRKGWERALKGNAVVDCVVYRRVKNG